MSRHGLSAARDHLEAVDPVLDWSVHEDAGLGTVAVLVSEASTIESDTIDYSLADTAIRAPLDGFLNQHLCSNQAASVVVKQSNHLIDFNSFELDNEGHTIGFRKDTAHGYLSNCER